MIQISGFFVFDDVDSSDEAEYEDEIISQLCHTQENGHGLRAMERNVIEFHIILDSVLSKFC